MLTFPVVPAHFPVPELKVHVPWSRSSLRNQSVRPRRRSPSASWNSDDGWYACRAFRCRDYIVVLAPHVLTHEHGLTQRELEILTLLVDGSSNEEIAGRLWISPRTVRAHVEHVLVKLDVPTRAAAASRAMEDGLLLSPEVIAYVKSRRR